MNQPTGIKLYRAATAMRVSPRIRQRVRDEAFGPSPRSVGEDMRQERRYDQRQRYRLNSQSGPRMTYRQGRGSASGRVV